MPKMITRDQLDNYQKVTFRTAPGLQLTSPEEALEFVNQRGFIFFWPVKNTLFPSLWTSVAGSRPVADEHDDPGHITWGWKDSMLDKRVWYYARVLRRKNTLISLEAAKFFYTLSPNYGEPEADMLLEYAEGKIPLEVKLIFEALSRNGPLDTLSLRKAAHLTSPESQSPFNRALDLLQAQFRVIPVAISEAGAWKYAFVYDLTHRYYPEIVESARFLTEKQAMEQILNWYFRSLGAANLKQVVSFFRWNADLTQQTLDRLTTSGFLSSEISIEGINSSAYCLRVLQDDGM